jgi:hypothetical protein
MEQDLLRLLLAAFPRSASGSSCDSDPTDDYLVICGYRVPFDFPAAIDRG